MSLAYCTKKIDMSLAYCINKIDISLAYYLVMDMRSICFDPLFLIKVSSNRDLTVNIFTFSSQSVFWLMILIRIIRIVTT